MGKFQTKSTVPKLVGFNLCSAKTSLLALVRSTTSSLLKMKQTRECQSSNGQREREVENERRKIKRERHRKINAFSIHQGTINTNCSEVTLWVCKISTWLANLLDPQPTHPPHASHQVRRFGLGKKHKYLNNINNSQKIYWKLCLLTIKSIKNYQIYLKHK